MKRGAIFAAIVIAYVGVAAGQASAAPADGAGPWADYVVSANQGFAINGGFLPNRSDPQAAVGIAESPPGNDNPIKTGTFFSLGFQGSLTLGFDNPICNRPGDDLDIEVIEHTLEPYPIERAQVFVSEDGVNFLFAGVVDRDDQVAMPAGITVANFVRLVDLNNPADYAGLANADGFDVDGVRALSTDCPMGMIEVCKASTNGMHSRTFQFTLNGGAPFSVRGGRCSGPIKTQAGLNKVVELDTPPPLTEVSGVVVRPSARLISTDLANRTVRVKVITGSTAASESKVTFTNAPDGGTTGELKICKVSQAPQYWGRPFSFRVNGGPLFSVEATPPFESGEHANCRLAGNYRVGSRVSVQEEIPGGAEVAWIDTVPALALVPESLDTTRGRLDVVIGSGTTVVLFDNEPIPPPQAGYLEICKDAQLVEARTRMISQNGKLFEPDPYVRGLFTFTVETPDNRSFDVDVGVGQCTAPLVVPAGIVTITEHQRANHTLVDAYTIPEDRLLAVNLINRTVDVEVPVSSSPNDETQVHFVNGRDRAQLKICKQLGPGSSALSGRTFYFDVIPVDQQLNSVAPGASVIALAGSTQCVIAGDYPVGETYTIKESKPGEFVDVTGEGPVTIAPGTNSVTITNTAKGLLQICKLPVPTQKSQPWFRFRVDNGGFINIQAGTCRPAMRVSVGEHTISEVSERYYELDPNAPGEGIDVVPSERLVSKSPTARTVRVVVPYAEEGETRVDFYNRVKQGQIKLCKQVDPGSMDELGEMEFTYQYSVNGSAPYGVEGSIGHNECVLISRDGKPIDFPVLQPTGSPTVVSIDETEATFGSGILVDFHYQGSGSGPPNTDTNECEGRAEINPGPNTNTLTFINRTGFGCIGE